MGTISVNKLAGYSMVVGPVLALICYFITPGGMFIEPADPAKPSEVVAALQGNATLSAITGILVPVGLIVFFSGLSLFVANMSGGSGHAIARLGLPMVLISIIGWVIGSGISIGISGAGDGGAAMVAAFVPTQVGITAISTLGTILFGLGTMLIACAASTRDENNTYMAYVASLAGIVAVVTGVVGGLSSDHLGLMTQIGGVCFLVFTIWSIIIGLAMSSSD